MESEGLRQRPVKPLAPERVSKERDARARRKPSMLEEWTPLLHLAALISFFIFSSAWYPKILTV